MNISTRPANTSPTRRAIATSFERLPPEKFAQFMKGPEGETQTRVAGDPNWVESKLAIVATGLEAPGVASKFRMYDDYLRKMENALAQHAWLAGATFTLADIAMTPYVNRLDMLGMSDMWVGSRPRLTDWFARSRHGRHSSLAFSTIVRRTSQQT